MPVPAIVSIGHRASGILLFCLIPVVIFLLDLSLRDAAGFREVGELLSGGAAKWLLILLLWAGLHHLFAGLRLLLIDVGVGDHQPIARGSAWIVLAAAFSCALLAGMSMP